MPRIGLTRSALPPSAAIVRAVRQTDLTPSGNVPKSFKAALSQETGRVRGIIVLSPVGSSRSDVVIYDNLCQRGRPPGSAGGENAVCLPEAPTRGVYPRTNLYNAFLETGLQATSSCGS